MREGSGRFYRRPLLVGVKTLSSALSWSTEKEPYDQFRCGARLNLLSRPTPEQYGQSLTMSG